MRNPGLLPIHGARDAERSMRKKVQVLPPSNPLQNSSGAPLSLAAMSLRSGSAGVTQAAQIGDSRRASDS